MFVALANALQIAVCFYGLTRSLNHTHESIKARLLAPLRRAGTVTVLFHTYNVTLVTSTHAHEDHARNDPLTTHLLAPNHTLLESQEQFIASLPANFCRAHGDPWHDDYRSMTNLLCALHSQMRVTELLASLNVTFDVVVYARPDVLFYTALDVEQLLAARSDEIFVPSFHDWGGVNDRFAAGRHGVMEQYGRRGAEFPAYCARRPPHSETFLRDFLAQHNITVRRTPLLFARIRATGHLQEQPTWEMRYTK